MAYLFDGLEQVPAPALTDADRDHARRVVASLSTDAADAADLLRMVGLLAPAPKPRRPPGPAATAICGTTAAYRRGCRCDDCKAARRAENRAYYRATHEKGHRT